MYVAVRSRAPATTPSAVAVAPAAASRYRSSTAAARESPALASAAATAVVLAAPAAPRTPTIGAASSCTVYSGIPLDDGVRTRVTPGPDVLTTATARLACKADPPACKAGPPVPSGLVSAGSAAGTSIQLASAA